MTTIAKRALAFLESLGEDALRTFVEDAVGRETLEADEDVEQNAWIMGGATEYFTATAKHDSESAQSRVGEVSSRVTIGEGQWTAGLEDASSCWDVNHNAVLSFLYCPDLPDAA